MMLSRSVLRSSHGGRQFKYAAAPVALYRGFASTTLRMRESPLPYLRESFDC